MIYSILIDLKNGSIIMLRFCLLLILKNGIEEIREILFII